MCSQSPLCCRPSICLASITFCSGLRFSVPRFRSFTFCSCCSGKGDIGVSHNTFQIVAISSRWRVKCLFCMWFCSALEKGYCLIRGLVDFAFHFSMNRMFNYGTADMNLVGTLARAAQPPRIRKSARLPVGLRRNPTQAVQQPDSPISLIY